MEVLFWLLQIILMACRVSLSKPETRSGSSGGALRVTVLEYCASSTMHGLVYIALWQRVALQGYWTITFLAAVSLGAYLVASNYLVGLKRRLN